MLFKPEDESILTRNYEDTDPVEPEYYMPIIPMTLINGADGIGTGFSTKIPNYNPIDVIENISRLIKGKKTKDMLPWYSNFKGTVEETDNGSYQIKGTYHIDNSKNEITITELPIGEWTSNFKEFLDELLDQEIEKKPKAKGKDSKPVKKKNNLNLINYSANNTDTKVHFTLKFSELPDEEEFEKKFHMVKSIHTGNMHLYDKDGVIKRYENTHEILEDYYHVRLAGYEKRKEHQLNILRNQLEMLSYKAKFIQMILKNEIKVNNQPKAKVEEQLVDKKFPKLLLNGQGDVSYGYLLNMPIYSLTQEKVDELLKQRDTKEAEVETLEGKEIKDIWHEELDELKETYMIWQAENEKESATKAKPKKGKKSSV
jgi:DNA topoisomerase-2